MKRKLTIVAGIVVALLAGAYAVSGASNAGLLTSNKGAASPAGQGTAQQPASPAAELQADAYVVPIRYSELSVAVTGLVASVPVQEGVQVAAGTVLLSLRNDTQQAAVSQAQANLDQAEARLAALRAGPRAEEIAQAQAAVAGAQAHLDRLAGGPTPQEVAVAQQAVAVAQANLARVVAGPTPEELNQAAAAAQEAAAAVRQAQTAYDRVAGQPDVGMRKESLELQQATLEYEKAQASYQNLKNGPTAADIKVYEQQVAQAQAGLDQVQAGANPADVDAAKADLAGAQAALALTTAGARPEDLQAAEAEVAAARGALAQAQAALEQTILRAPFAGTVGAINVDLGEPAGPGAPVVRLGDEGTWAVETDNLTELDVVKLAVGDRVEVAFDALPGKTATGTVQHIQPASQIKRGDVTYKVTITLDAQDLPLYWGMTANVRQN